MDHIIAKIKGQVRGGSVGSEEHKRIKENVGILPPWWRWGPYVSERSWGTVREDYSPDGDAWRYLPHDLARSKAYRWGEDGLAGICDRYQLLVFALAFWNGRDPILKERAFGLDMWEGNHGEDVKEYYFYQDNTPSHSYMRYLYKYPQTEFPYRQLIEENRRRDGVGDEYELLDTGVFDEDRYFDIEIEYAKVSPDDICIKIKAYNRGPDSSPLHVLPHLWFRNTWAWSEPRQTEPVIELMPQHGDTALCLLADNTATGPLTGLLFPYRLGSYYLYADGNGKAMFTNNETNNLRVYGSGATNHSPYLKDAFHRNIIEGEHCVNPENKGTKSCVHYRFDIAGGESEQVTLRLTAEPKDSPLADVESVIAQRRNEADAFFAELHPPKASPEERCLQRQALSTLLWSKQVYLFDVQKWLEGDLPSCPPPESRKKIRNQHWRHLNSMRVLLMPDKWEYPWFAAWDLAFASVPMALIDPAFAKEQLWLMLFQQFQHPNGQIPAYEWDFSDLNPPVHAWAVWRVYNMEKRLHKRQDRLFLEKCFHKLLINFAWWVNKVDNQGNNIFEGGFLGLDNIAVVDRSLSLPDGQVLEQSDATGWMAMFCLNMMRIALELAIEDKAYEGLATKFLEHYFYIGAAMKHRGGRDYQLWDEDDGFFYDVLRCADDSFDKFRVRSLVGLIPLYAVERLESDWIEPFPSFSQNLSWFLENRNQFAQFCCHTICQSDRKTFLLSIPSQHQIMRMLGCIFDKDEFLSPFGMRSLSKIHAEHPFRHGKGQVGYEPAEAESKLKGGNSNWRGPVWFPVGFLMIESLRKLDRAIGPSFKLEVALNDDGLAAQMTLGELAEELANRMIKLFMPAEDGSRPIFGNEHRFQNDPNWKDHILLHEYFHAETGKGLGASHQTWTALLATLIDEWRR
ncbi:MAG: MGH1-like glycoside hydrolase domain-containing protein [Gammaproteobacteria bacterium]